MKKIIFALCSLLFASTLAMAQQVIPLYPGPIPNSTPVPNEEKTEVNADGITIISKITQPSINVFLPDPAIATGTSVVIFPGGGYWINAYVHEGTDVARRFNEMGVAAFVVKYRIPDDVSMPNREIGPIQDAQQAIKTVRERAAEWGLLPDRVGVMGFSAGGHLASTAGTHFNRNFLPDATTVSLRPDFMILVYPVISFLETHGHIGSREQIIGKKPTQAQIEYYSNELQVTPETPPTFLVHASNDWLSVENSIQMYQSLIRNKVPAEMHLYEKGSHGFGMNNPTTSDAWMDRCQNWMQSNGWLTNPASTLEIGLQLYSLRNQIPKDIPGTLQKVSKWGIKEIELGGTYGMKVPEFKALLMQNNLKAISYGTEFEDLVKDPQAVSDQAKALGSTYVVCFWIPHKGNDFTIEDVQKAIKVFNAAGKVLKDNGLSLCYHPHGYEFRPYKDGTLFDYMMEQFDPQYINFEMDVFWVKHPGQDPVALLRQYPNRFLLMHLKDRAPGTIGNQNGKADVESNVVLGKGDVGIGAIMDVARAAGVRHFFIEDESSRSEMQIQESLLFLKERK